MEPPREAPPPPELEFGGPWGAGALSLLLPLGLVGVVSATVGEGRGGAWGAPSPPLAAPTPPTLALVLAWVGALGMGARRPPRSPGDPPGPLRDLGWLLLLGGALGGSLALGVPLPPLCPLLPPLAAAASSVAFGLALLILARRRLRGGGTGHPVYEFFVGGGAGTPLEPPENLNWERVGLCAWELSVNPAPGPGGFLGLFGGLAWGPFGGPLPALLLLRRPQQGLGGAGGAACGGLYALGLWIFHGATTQRSLFSHDPRDPRVAGLATVPTATGQLLLAGGWWGLVRRPDDLGELLMALGWTLPCGLSPPLLLLLAGAALRELRALQGERRQRRRFGGAWGGLCQRVPHRLLPLLY
ncbi:delta(14)-sterol reductase TM7SF2 isoform X2 [Zonotrichia leucophrys gambelii]|uniref:delta(14)-sterol reductase TM7SF2 isoform X2 n=1 Tax=Zonotrichia leucophrys gambelii TaxID=257770 RepID=UPI0031400508